MPNPKDCRTLGRALSIMARADAVEIVMHADVDAFHAPSECHGLVKRGEAKRIRQARRHAEAVAGMSARHIRAEARRRIGSKALHKATERATGEAAHRLSPFSW